MTDVTTINGRVVWRRRANPMSIIVELREQLYRQNLRIADLEEQIKKDQKNDG